MPRGVIRILLALVAGFAPQLTAAFSVTGQRSWPWDKILDSAFGSVGSGVSGAASSTEVASKDGDGDKSKVKPKKLRELVPSKFHSVLKEQSASDIQLKQGLAQGSGETEGVINVRLNSELQESASTVKSEHK